MKIIIWFGDTVNVSGDTVNVSGDTVNVSHHTTMLYRTILLFLVIYHYYFQLHNKALVLCSSI